MANVSLVSVLDRVELHQEPKHLKQIVDESVSRQQALAAEKDITIRTTYGTELGVLSLVSIDPKRFMLVVDNLIQNAIKYSYPGTVIEAKTTDTSKSVILSVTNIGARIPRDKREEIFKKFIRLSEEEAQFKWRPGTGIGLALVKRLVELHDGEISVESTNAPRQARPLNHTGPEPHRTTFAIILPRYT